MKSRAARSSARPGAKDATLPGSVTVTAPASRYEFASQALATEIGFTLTADEIIRSSLANMRPPTDLELTDAALWELEEANLVAYGHLEREDFTAENMAAATLRPPSQGVQQLIMRLQETHDPGQRSHRLRRRPLRNTVSAHEELIRLQGYLMRGADVPECQDCGVLLSAADVHFTRCSGCRQRICETTRQYKAAYRARQRDKESA